MIHFETHRLQIRDFTPDDLNSIERIAQKPDFYYSYFAKGGTPQEFIEQAVSNLPPQERSICRLAISNKASQQIIGACAVLNPKTNFINILNQHGCELGLFIDPTHQNQGYGKECAITRTAFAFKIYKCDTLYTTVHPENEASIRIQVALGFRYIKTGNLEPSTNLHENVRNVYQLHYLDFIS